MMRHSNSQVLMARLKEFRPGLFDYCMRMTGDAMKASGVVQDACAALVEVEVESGGGRMGTFDDIRAFLFREARVLARESWHADTAALRNPRLVPGQAEFALIRLDEIMRHLPGELREVILLVERYKFSPQVAAQIAGFEADRFDAALAAAWQHLLTRLPSGAVPVGSAGQAGPIERLPDYPEPAMEHQMPVTNLSEIMDELDSTRRGVGMRSFWFLLFIFVVGAGYFWLKRHPRQ